jgi:predicted amidohydrolase YtcJ
MEAEAAPVASAVAVRRGRIVYVGDDAGAAPFVGPRTEVVALDGRLVLPGFHDTHVHPLGGGLEQGDCDLTSAESGSEVARLLSVCAEQAPEGAWVRGGGYQMTFFPRGEPTRALLDSLVPGAPAYLTDATGHSAWANSRAFALAGVGTQTPDPGPDGIIVRAPDGSPQGTLREAAMGLVGRHVPPHTDLEMRAGLTRALELAASLGVTTLHEASADERALRAYADAEREGRLTARVIVALTVDPGGGPGQVAELARLRALYEGPLLRPAAAKIFLDGVIEGGTAALLEPYLDRTGWRGELRMEVEPLSALVAALDSAGFKVHLHAIGDRAVRTALDALERQHQRDGGSGPRHLLAHLQLVDPADMGRFAEFGVVASFQPLWAQRDAYITDLTEPRLGAERSSRLYPIESVRATGAMLAAGSDWPVTSMDPLDAIEVAVTRRGPGEPAGDAWIPEERLSLEDAVRAYTLGGALAGDLEVETGSIVVGKRADLAVLERDPFTIDPRAISDVRVDLTVLEGRVMYRRVEN